MIFFESNIVKLTEKMSSDSEYVVSRVIDLRRTDCAFFIVYYNLLVCHKASPFAEEGVSFKLITAVKEYKVLNQSGVVRPFPIYSTSGQLHAQGVRRVAVFIGH